MEPTEKNVAIIPARGGSRGVPDKNLKRVGGTPLIARCVATARNARTVDDVFVSTGDERIKEVSRSAGATVIHRPESLRGPQKSSESALIQALLTIRDEMDLDPDLVSFLQCTSPFTLPEDLEEATELLRSRNLDVVFSACETHQFLWRLDDEQQPVGINHNSEERKRRQDRDRQFRENGALYIMKARGFLEAEHRFFGEMGLYEMPVDRSIEIDDFFDLDLARMIDRNRHTEQARKQLSEPDIRAVVFDFDGVFTENGVWLSEEGTESIRCDRRDGYGLEKLSESGVRSLVITRERNRVVSERCKKLGIPVRKDVSDKASVLKNWMNEENLPADSVVYVGNDLNDLPAFQAAGTAVAVSDAHERVRERADVILKRAGGHGAVRELCELICSGRGDQEPSHE